MNWSLLQAIIRRLSLKENQSRLFPWQSFSPRDWEQALTWMDLSGLAIYFLQAIRGSSALDALPAGVKDSLEQRSAANVSRTQAILEELKVLTRALNEASVRYAVLKGFSLVPDYCPDPALRTQYDHDLLVDAAGMKTAEDVLQQLGYRRKVARDAATSVYRKPDPDVRFAHTSEGLYSAVVGRSVELHLALWEEDEDRIRIPLRDDFLERSVLRQFHGIEYLALCDEDCLLFQILHAFKHILRNWCRLSIFLEITYFLEQRSTAHNFWNRFLRRMEGLQWAPEATQIVFALAELLFGGHAPAEVRSALETRLSPALALWIERYGQHSALSNFHDDKSSLFLHEEFVENPSDWAAIRRRRLFPVQRPHRPPAVIFQRDFSRAGKMWMDGAHALRRLSFHGMAALWYAVEYPRWILLRRLRLAEAENAW